MILVLCAFVQILLPFLVQRVDAQFGFKYLPGNFEFITAYDSEDANPGPTWALVDYNSLCGSSYVTERVGDQARFKFKGTSITIYGANSIEGGKAGGNTEITLDEEETQTITNRTVDLLRCYPAELFRKSRLTNTIHTVTVTLVAGINGTNLLYIMGVDWYNEEELYYYDGELITYFMMIMVSTSLACLIALQCFCWMRHRTPMRRPTYHIYYDPSDMPPFSKSKPQPPALDHDSKSATQLPTTGDSEPPPEFHIQPTPPSSTLT